MRRSDREMPKEFALEIVDNCAWATVSMIDADGQPYCVPVSIARAGEQLYFHCAQKGKKTDALRKNPKVCVSCVGDVCPSKTEFTTGFASATIFGQAREVADEQEKIQALKLICERYTPENMANFDSELARSLRVTAVWRIDMEEITGKQKQAKPALA